jgi:ABC-type phosphate transport system ATPase subunit
LHALTRLIDKRVERAQLAEARLLESGRDLAGRNANRYAIARLLALRAILLGSGGELESPSLEQVEQIAADNQKDGTLKILRGALAHCQPEEEKGLRLAILLTRTLAAREGAVVEVTTDDEEIPE